MSAKLASATIEVSLDEPCFNLVEVNLMHPSGRALHRYLILSVVRGGRLAEYREDMGPAVRYGQQLRIPGGVFWDNGRFECLHTVGELLDIAEELRAHPPLIPDPVLETPVQVRM
jgi:hypothetical protein